MIVCYVGCLRYGDQVTACYAEHSKGTVTGSTLWLSVRTTHQELVPGTLLYKVTTLSSSQCNRTISRQHTIPRQAIPGHVEE